MDKQETPKPPWEQVVFQKTPASIEISNPFWVDQWLEQDHASLTSLKQSITPFEENKTWETIKKISNSYELIYTNEAPHFPPSLAMMKPLSRSFFKMVEMLEVSQFFQTLPKQTNTIRSAHVAEGPGGFIEALSDRCSLHKKTLQKAFAITLKPNGSNVPGWKRAHTFLQRHPEVLIHYGRDGTGDIYHLENQASFLELCSGRTHVFTADGGFDFSEDYATQEKNVYPLLLASCKIGLQALLPGGLFIMKLFDVFGKPTQYLLRLITSCFRDWTLYKPATSRPCNSERYLLCRGFRRCTPDVLRILTNLESQYNSNHEYPDISGNLGWTEKEASYLESHIQSFTKLQCETIQKSFDAKHKSLDAYNWTEQIQNAHSWCTHFRIIDQLMLDPSKYKLYGYKKPY